MRELRRKTDQLFLGRVVETVTIAHGEFLLLPSHDLNPMARRAGTTGWPLVTVIEEDHRPARGPTPGLAGQARPSSRPDQLAHPGHSCSAEALEAA